MVPRGLFVTWYRRLSEIAQEVSWISAGSVLPHMGSGGTSTSGGTRRKSRPEGRARSRGPRVACVCILLLVGGVQGVLAQQRPDSTTAPPSDTTVVPSDTTAAPSDTTVTDTTAQSQRPSSAIPDSVQQRMQGEGAPGGQQRPPGAPGGSGGENSEAVSFSAKDSLVIRTDSAGSNFGTLHGNARMSYQGASLESRIIEMNFQTSTLEATGPPSDTAQGGRPVFKRGSGEGGSGGGPGGMGGGSGGQSFTGDVLSYNLSTERGRVVDARTERRDGYVQGGAVKMYEDSTLFVQQGTYTTCDCPPDVTPSYSLRSSEMKIDGKWVYTGPIQLFLFNVPTPLWLPFGFLPNVQGRRSGPLPPEYGEDNKGFYLQNWGWYFALNSYTDLTLRASVWSKGSYEIRPRFRYRKRYEYNGDFQLTYRRVRIGESEDPNPTRRHEGQLTWNHSQDLSPTASLNGDIDLATSSDFARRNSDNYNDAVRQDVSSTVRYNKRWPNGGRQFNISASQSQQFQSGQVEMTLPNLGFSQNSFKPFKREQRIGDERWYEKITTSYNLDVRNTYSFNPRDPEQLREEGDSTLADEVERADVTWYEALADRDKYQLATGDDELYDFQATHRIPLNMSFRVDRYNLSLSPSFNYNSDWYLNTVRRVAERDSTGGVGEIEERTVPGFYARHDFNSSFSASTELFGTFPVGVGSFQGLRHRLNPSLSMNYRPNFNAPFWGRTRVLRYEDYEDGEKVPEDSLRRGRRRYDIRGGSFVRGSTQQWSLNFSLGNVFETKRVITDTSSSEQRTETVQLLNLDVSGLSYNFAADSFRVGNNISVSARTQVDPFNISVQSSFSPYALRPRTVGEQRTFRRVDRLMVAESPLTPARLTRFDVSMSASFSSDGQGGRMGGSQRGRRRQSSGMGQSRRSGQRGRTSQQQRGQQRRGRGTGSQLTELKVPWSLDFNFNYGLQKPRKEVTNRTATLGVSFSLNVTSMWRVRGNTGYDFIQGKLSTTRFNISRNLGCWNMSFHWVPFGEYQKYGFNLQVSSGQLSQLLQLQVPNKGGEGRFGGFGQQLQGTVQGAAGAGGMGRGGMGGGSRF